MQKTKIEWTDYVFNPIKGLCPVDCKLPNGKSYCYARAMYKRFKWDPEIRFALDDSDYTDRFSNKLKLPAGTKVFTCSTFEMFHPVVKKEWRDVIFFIIEENPNIVFQILTKMPENIDRPMPDNVHLGVSITTQGELKRYRLLNEAIAQVKFISFEPLLSYIELPVDFYVDWVIIGKLTGFAKWRNPEKYWVDILIERLRDKGIPIFLKNNLKEIWGEKLIQEWPK